MRTNLPHRIVATLLLVLLGSTVAQGTATAPFTEEQAERGAAVFAASCAACHGAELEGMGHFPALAGADFQAAWAGKSLAELHAYVHANMPLGQGGSLSDQAYLDVVAFLLAKNGYAPAGSEVELAAEALEGVVLEAPAAD